MNHKQSTRRDQKNGENSERSSDEFVYNPDAEKYIGKRTGNYYRRIKPKENFDGFPRFSEYASFGLRNSSSTAKQEISEFSLPDEKPSPQKQQPPQENKQQQQSVNASDDFIFEPKERPSNHSSSRMPPSETYQDNQFTFPNISTIKRLPSNNIRTSDQNCYRKLVDYINGDEEQFSYKEEQILSKGFSAKKQTPPEEKQEIKKVQVISKKKKSTGNRVSFKQTPNIFFQSSESRTDTAVIIPDNKKEDQRQKFDNQRFLRQLQAKHEEQQRIKDFEQKQAREKKLRDQERKSRLKQAFSLTDDEKNDKEQYIKRFSHHRKEQKQLIVSKGSEENFMQRQDENEFAENSEKYTSQGSKPQRGRGGRKKSNASKKSKDKEKEERPKSRSQSRKRQTNTDGRAVKKDNRKRSEKGKRGGRKPRMITQISKPIQKIVQHSEASEVDESNKQSRQSKPKKRSKKREIMKESQPSKMRKRDNLEFFDQIKSQSAGNDNGRYPKRIRVKPLQYWENEKINYKEGKAVRITQAHVNFLKLIGADAQESYEITTNLNLEEDSVEGEITLPPRHQFSCRGFEDPFKILAVSLSQGQRNLEDVEGQVTLDDGIVTVRLTTLETVFVEQYRVFTIENQSKKPVKLSLCLFSEDQ